MSISNFINKVHASNYRNHDLFVYIGDKFRQQKMDSWHPVMTPIKIIILFLVVGICFLPTGISIFTTSNDVSFFLLIISYERFFNLFSTVLLIATSYLFCQN